MVSPLADARYHERGPLQIQPLKAHQVSSHPGDCPECMAMQTLAVPGSPTYVLRSSWAREEIPAPKESAGYSALRITTAFPRAPPTPPGATL